MKKKLGIKTLCTFLKGKPRILKLLIGSTGVQESETQIIDEVFDELTPFMLGVTAGFSEG